MRGKLPARTQIYITNGAEEGKRNSELLAAACQCRDAGMTKHEAEQLLVARALSDGLTLSEANGTVNSAFSKTSREPIQVCGQRTDGKFFKLTPEQRHRIEMANSERCLAMRAHAAQAEILQRFGCGSAYYGKRSPVTVAQADPRNDWRLILRLFRPDDVIWIGTKKNDSANDKMSPDWIQYCKTRFRPAAEWLSGDMCPGILTVPSIFKPGTHSRCNAEIVVRRFIVIESDTLDKDQVCAVFRWTEQFSRLRAIVDTGGKSLHGWFEMPEPDVLSQLETILPALGCDPALFVPSQPCRLPGGLRRETGRFQSLLYLDVEGGI